MLENPATPLLISSPATVLIASSPQPLPHRVCRLLSLIQLHYQGRSLDNTWKRVRISLDEYQALQDALEKDTRLGAWVTDKLQYDYNSINDNLVLCMPSPLYNIFAIRLQKVITRELKALKEVLEKKRYILGKKHTDTI